MKVSIEIPVRQGHVDRYELWYSSSGILEAVMNSEGKCLMMSIAISGDDIKVGSSQEYFGMQCGITGAMVALHEAGIVVPYRIFADMPAELVMKANP